MMKNYLIVAACLIGIPVGVGLTALYAIGIMLAGAAVVDLLR